MDSKNYFDVLHSAIEGVQRKTGRNNYFRFRFMLSQWWSHGIM